MEILTKHCKICRVELSEENAYVKSGRKKQPFFPYCKKHFNALNTERQRRNKRKAVEVKGGKCISCGYNKSFAALDFHHRNREEKDRSNSRLFLRSWENILKEIEKCDLLCANCHREEEERLAFVAERISSSLLS